MQHTASLRRPCLAAHQVCLWWQQLSLQQHHPCNTLLVPSFISKHKQQAWHKQKRGTTGIEPVASPTQRENHTTRPSSLVDRCRQNEKRTYDSKSAQKLTVAARLQGAPIQRRNTLIRVFTVLALFLTVFRRLKGLLAPSGAQAGHGSAPWAGTGSAAASRCLVLTTHDTNNAREPSAALLRKPVSMSR